VARKLEQFPSPHKSRYPWDEYLDGDVWELTVGEDFTSKLSTFRMNAKVQAKKRGGNVRSTLQHGEGGGPDKLVIQFFRGNGEA
jgi:hypothetical protein